MLKNEDNLIITAATLVVKIEYLPNDQIEKTGKNSLENEVNLIISSIVNAVAKSPFFTVVLRRKNKGKMAHFRSLQEPESIKGKTSYKSVVVEGERIQPAMSSQAKLEWNFKWHFMEKKQTD